jgi:hypothetical protein
MDRKLSPARRRSTPTELGGGGGFNFEDWVAAALLANLLCGERLFLPSIKYRILSIAWQVGEKGWRLNDLLLALGEDSPASSLALSIKRDQQVTRGGFPKQFVRHAWLHWIGGENDPFDRERDYLGLAPGVVSEGVRTAWSDLLEQARLGEPAAIAERFSPGGTGGNKVSRALFASLRCPPDLPRAGPSEAAERILLVRRIRLLSYDLRFDPSTAVTAAVGLCRKAMASGDADDARKLWWLLVKLAAERRPKGGFLDRRGLQLELGPSFELLELPDHQADWRRVVQVAEDAARGVKEVVGLGVRLERPVLGEVRQRLLPGRRTLLVGLSGSGKSALAKAVAQQWRGPLLWLDAQRADAVGLVGLQRALGLGHSISDLARDAPGLGLLVLDGLEGWSPRALENAVALLGIVPPLGNWSLLATSRPDAGWGILGDLESAMRGPFDPVEVGPLTDPEMRSLLRDLPWLVWLLPRPGLDRLLRNLKALDWLAAAFGDITAERAKWVSPSDVHDALWQRWCGTAEDSDARAELLKRLAREEADAMRSAVARSSLDPAERPILRALVNHELVEVSDNLVRFRHDLGADWARLQVLIEGGALEVLADRLPEYTRSPRWHAAIRLYGERLLDRGDDEGRQWCHLFDSLAKPSDAAENARDLLLDSLVSASPPGAGLQRLWPRLIAGGGELLGRLLGRFLFVETAPAPVVAVLADDPESLAAGRAIWRVPASPFWPALLVTLHHHRREVAELVSPDRASEVCCLWLRYTTHDVPYRREAAALALEIARAARGRSAPAKHAVGRSVSRSSIFEAALIATAELPDEVAGLALELAERRPEPSRTDAPQDHGDAIEPDAGRLPTDHLFHSLAGGRSRRWPVFADGPLRKVDEAFRAAVLEADCLVVLARSRPLVAREVLLACCLRPPERPLFVDELGMVIPRGWEATAPMYWRGPFLGFLHIDIENGTEAILRLVNQATANWASLQETAAGILVPQENAVEWLGNREIYAWCRGEGHPRPVLAASALMALEKWLYDAIDAGRDVEPVLRKILTGSRSVAFAGVLVGVGKNQPGFFSGSLQCLLGCWPLYRWDRLTEQNPLFGFDLGTFVPHGEKIFNLARDWHHLPHRRRTLLGIAVRLLRKRPAVADAFARFRSLWRGQSDARDTAVREDIEQLCAILDRANHQLVHRAGAPSRWEFHWPEALRVRKERELAKLQPSLRATAVLEECRRLLGEDRSLGDADAEALWHELRRMVRSRRGSSLQTLSADWVDVTGAALAVLMHLGRGWIDQEPSRKRWCRRRLVEMSKQPLRGYVGDSMELVSLWGWPHFAVIAAVAWLAENPRSRPARRIVAEALADRGGRGGLTRMAMHCGFGERERLGSEWRRMQSFALFWAALCFVGRSWSTKDPLDRWRSRLVEWFVAGTIPTEQPSWEKLAGRARSLRDWLYRREEAARIDEFASSRFLPVTPADPGLELPVLRAAFQWLGGLGGARDASERRDSIELYRRLLDVGMPARRRTGWRPTPEGLEEEAKVGSGLDEYRRWLLPLLARLIAELPTPGERRAIWERLLVARDERGGGRRRSELFLDAWFSQPPATAAGAIAFIEHWREMLDWAFSTSSPLAAGRAELLGLGLRMGAPQLDQALYRRPLATLLPFYKSWSDGGGLDSAFPARSFARFLMLPASCEMLLPGIELLGAAVGKWRAPAMARSERADLCRALIPVLRAAWEAERARVRGELPLRTAFQELLEWAVAGGMPAALDLQEQVRTTM